MPKKIFLLLLLLSGASQALSAPISEHHLYEESQGEKREPIHWDLEQSDQYHLSFVSPEQTNLTDMDLSGNTVEWRCDDPEAQTQIMARREKTRIHLTGRLNGEAVDREVTIDEAPWFQASSLSLRHLVLSDEQKITFWTLRAGTLDAYKLLAEKKGEEPLSILGKPETVVHVTLRATGWLAHFYKSDFWFRKRDGVLMRFAGPSGPPGAPLMMLDYRGVPN